jgi:hypothetical protein
MNVVVELLVERATAALKAAPDFRQSDELIFRRDRLRWWLDYGAKVRKIRCAERDIVWFEQSIKGDKAMRRIRAKFGLPVL